MKKDNINLLENYLLTEKQRKNTGSKGLNFIAIFLAIALLLSAYSLKLYLDDRSLKESNKDLQSYVSDPNVLAQIQQITTKQRQLTDLNEILVELKSLNAAFAAMPMFDTATLNTIDSSLPIDTKIVSMDYDGQWLNIRTVSSNFIRSSEFARNLRNTKYFEDVIYYGYEQDAGRYYGNILVALKVGQ